ncbi:cofilin/actin-depolymerizing factor homolog isoform X2 [Rhipicephalus microplus]|uniref:cofilin/actin-depolymerizing factor homolog isoform X2 n=1 Tax=Rhipicephalus microplus TaxID=6941 RepID=UPI003F6B88D1
MSTGMTFSDEAKAVNEARKTDKKYRYVIYKVVGESVIDAEATGERSAPLENFLEELRPREAGQCRCAVYDYPVTADDGTTTDKTFLITWLPNGANTRQRMLYLSAYETLRQQVTGIDKFLEAASVEELEDSMKGAVWQ